MNDFKLYPAILTDAMNTMVEQLESVKSSEYIDRVHIDVIDGQFTDNITLSPLDITVIDFGDLELDLHVMTEEPMDVVFECEAVREYLPLKRIIAQVERMSNQADFIHEVKHNDWKVGLALDIFTPLEAIDPSSWEDIDTVLLMAIEAGHQEEMFNPIILDKIKELRQMKNAGHINILVDGGIKVNNITRVLNAGANEVAVGSALWKNDEPTKVIEEFFAAAEKVADR